MKGINIKFLDFTTYLTICKKKLSSAVQGGKPLKKALPLINMFSLSLDDDGGLCKSRVLASRAIGQDTSVNGRVNEPRGGLGLHRPSQKLIGHILNKGFVNNPKTLAVLGDLVPITLNILEVPGHVTEGTLIDLAIDFTGHVGLHFDKEFISNRRLSEHEVSASLDGLHEGSDLLGILGNKGFIANEQDLDGGEGKRETGLSQ